MLYIDTKYYCISLICIFYVLINYEVVSFRTIYNPVQNWYLIATPNELFAA